MCGIFCCVAENADFEHLSADTLLLLRNRGPDYFGMITADGKGCIRFTLYATVLHLRGKDLVEQPVADREGNLLAWNGELFGLTRSADWDSDECDTLVILRLLGACNGQEEHIFSVMNSVKGPFAFVYFHKQTSSLYFGRDFLGRRSLVWQNGPDGGIYIGSFLAFPGISQKYGEVSPDGLHKMDSGQNYVKLIPWSKWKTSSCPMSDSASPPDILIFNLPVCVQNLIKEKDTETLPIEQHGLIWPVYSGGPKLAYLECCLQNADVVDILACFHNLFRTSVETRIRSSVQYCRNCTQQCDHCNFAILFSGGIDSMIVAYFVDQFVPKDQPIDLLNVSFASSLESEGKSEAPDRKTGKEGLTILQKILPHRCWNFIQINILKPEMEKVRTDRISRLILPQQTVLDCSLGTALWFAARGRGKSLESGLEYTSPARVVLSGLGADELLGGYSRHRSCFEKSGGNLERLKEELDMDIRRIGTRNCGRDDRIISDHGREVRYPFLDEDLVSFLTQLPVTSRCDLRLSRGLGDKLLLRLLAYSLGLKDTAVLEKRALQFGCKIAKVDGTKSGTEQSSWLIP